MLRRAAAHAAAPRRTALGAPLTRARACVPAQQLCSYLDKYSKALIVHADNVGSNQLMNIRKARGRPAPCRGATAGGRRLRGAWRRGAASETLNPGAHALPSPPRRVCARTALC